MRGVERQVIDIPLAGKLDTKSDPRALDVPGMSRVDNADFTELGGLQTRKPYVDTTAAFSLPNVRRFAVHNDELIAFTKDAIYSYSAAEDDWISRGTYLAPLVAEAPAFQNQSEQITPDCATHTGVTLYAWTEQDNTGAFESFVAATDAATGTVLLAPTSLGANTRRPRVFATTNKLMVLWVDTDTGLTVGSYSPTNIAAGAEGTAVVTATVTSLGFDAVASGTSLFVAHSENTQYTCYQLTESRTTAASATKSETSDGPIAIDYDASHVSQLVYVARTAGTDVKGDVMDNAFDDGTMDTTIGSITSGQCKQITLRTEPDNYDPSPPPYLYKAHAVWSSSEVTTETTFDCETNWFDGAGNTGSETRVVRRCGLASHAFRHDGDIYIWLATGGLSQGVIVAAIQDSYFLYRLSDALLVAKAVSTVAGGFSSAVGHVPGVQDLGSNKYRFCGLEKRRIFLGQNQQGYSAKSPREVSVTFDSDAARRSVQLGRTLYITGGQVMQYDGRSLVELGFHTFPWAFPTLTDAGSGTLAAGDYSLRSTYSRVNAQGEQERSTTATIDTVTCAASGFINATTMPLHVTLKGDDVAVEFWRTTVDPVATTPFRLASSPNPTASGTNGYLANDQDGNTIGTFADSMVDATLLGKEIYPETGGVLESVAPPACSLIAATQDRLFIAGIAGKPYTIWYSKLRGEGELASFNEILSLELPSHGGAITAISWLNETMIVFKERAVYAVPGDGFDNAGGGNNYGPARLLSNDIGATSAEAVGITPQGILFHSEKGWYLLGQGWQTGYVGAPVEDYDGDTFVGVHVLDGEHKVLCVSTARVLAYDYLADAWSVWTLPQVSLPTASIVYDGVHHYSYSSGSNAFARAQASTFASDDDGTELDVETAWIKVSGLQGYQSVRRLLILGEYRASSGSVRVRVAYNFAETAASGVTWVDDKTWTITPTTNGAPLQVRHTPSRRKCQAIKVRITAAEGDIALTSLALEVGLKRGPFRQLPAAQKQ